ncbi:MAG: hypothetical protein IKF55_02000, partial [Oscillospiraceae bacterium]|nr:hypothetical protein [Oscillospiraceae bacterium]
MNDRCHFWSAIKSHPSELPGFLPLKNLLRKKEQVRQESQLSSQDDLLSRNRSMSSKDLSLFAIVSVKFQVFCHHVFCDSGTVQV